MKHLTPKQKKITDIAVTVIEVILVIFAITLSAIIIANPNQASAKVGSGKTKLLPVLSGSMDGDKKDSFKEGDLIVATDPGKNIYKLEVDQIITFKGSVNGYDALITHRIVGIIKDADGNAQTYITHGDANPVGEQYNEKVNANDVLAVYKYHLGGVGSAISWLQDSTHFLLVIVLPLILLFIYNIIMFVRMMMQWKLEKAGVSGAAVIDEEEIKRKAVEEYIASQKAAELPAEEADSPASEPETETSEDGAGDKE